MLPTVDSFVAGPVMVHGSIFIISAAESSKLTDGGSGTLGNHFRAGWRTPGLRTNLRLHRKGGGRM